MRIGDRVAFIGDYSAPTGLVAFHEDQGSVTDFIPAADVAKVKLDIPRERGYEYVFAHIENLVGVEDEISSR